MQRKEELIRILSNIDVFICVETWLFPKNKDVFGIQVPGYKMLRKDRVNSPGGGILFLIKNHLDVSVLSDLNTGNDNFEVMGMRINNVNPQFNVIACYRPPDKNTSQEDWDHLGTNIVSGSHTLLMGDFNAHHVFWNCKGCDTNGNRLLESTEKTIYTFTTQTHYLALTLHAVLNQILT